MTDRTERLYSLLPGIYRQNDLEGGEPLRALLSVLERELDVLERDIEAAYDNWFVQTCDVWVLPYLADLVGLPPMDRQRHIFSTQRRQVANAIAYGRRKGTLGVLEHALRDVTGWHFCAVEMARQLAATTRLSGTPQIGLATADMRDTISLVRMDGPFNQQGHGADVHALAATEAVFETRARAGRYNLGRLGLFVWRLHSYTLRGCPARNLSRTVDGFPLYAIDPSGRELPLFNQPIMPINVAERLAAHQLPLPITRAELAADLTAYRVHANQRSENRPPASAYYGSERGLSVALRRAADQPPEPVPPYEVASVDLAVERGALSALSARGVRVAIDPERGWLAALERGQLVDEVVVDYAYGFSGEIGGGSYHRRALQELPEGARLIVVAHGAEIATLRAAFHEWEAHCNQCKALGEAPRGVIRILDNGIYEDKGGDLRLALPPGSDLTITADNGVRPTIGASCRLVVTCDPPLLAAVLGDSGNGSNGRAAARTWSAGQSDARLLYLDGLRFDGGMRVEWLTMPAGTEGRLEVQVRHCTIAPAGIVLDLIDLRAQATLLQIQRSIVGRLLSPLTVAGVVISDSIIDGSPYEADLHAKGSAVSSAPGDIGPPLTLARVTVLGDLRVAALSSQDSLIAGQVFTGEAQPVAQIPRQDRALRFTATRLGEPGYCQLHLACPANIRRGANDGGELGVFHDLHHPQAIDNLAPTLGEYLPLGLEAGIFFVT
jgi:phage tail-like protein